MTLIAVRSGELSLPTQELHARFLAVVPLVEKYVRAVFRGYWCRDKQQDAVCEAIALAWKCFIRLIERGKAPESFRTALARYTAMAVKSGRRLCGQDKAKDVLSKRAQQKHGFSVNALSDHGSPRPGNAFHEALHDNAQTPIPDQVSFRQDFPAWLRTKGKRDRRMIRSMMMGHATSDLAREHGISSARVSMKRREFCEDWHAFCGETV